MLKRSEQGVQDNTKQDRSDLYDRSARFILAKRETYLAQAAHFRQDRPIVRPYRTDPKARLTQYYYLMSEDFRTAKTPIPETNRNWCDPRSRSRHLQIEIAATQDRYRRTPARGVKIPHRKRTLSPKLSARLTSFRSITKSSSQHNRRLHKVSTRLYNKARIGVPHP